jgi:hypothetical protein
MRYSLFSLLLFAAVACENPAASSRALSLDELSDLTLTTDRNLYTATPVSGAGSHRMYGFTVMAQFTNRLSRPVYLERCYPSTPIPIYGVVPVEGQVEAGYDPVWACVGHDSPIVVGAGETRTDSLRIVGPNAWDGHTKEPLGTLVGHFQLRYAVGACPEVDGCGGGTRSRGSNNFEVRLEP